ncbi:MAG: putative Ig domain-containing protein [Ignavibacteriota bacterium]
MKVHGGNLRLGVWLLLAAAVPAHAQFTTYGCPQGAAQTTPLNGLTAGSPNDAQICMLGPANFWGIQTIYTATLTDTLTNTTVTIPRLFADSDTLLRATVPSTFFPSVQTPGQPDPVTISVSFPTNLALAPATGTFQINPPITLGTSVFVTAVNQPLAFTMYSGGTPPYTNTVTGSTPAGLTIPTNSAAVSGTPTQAGFYAPRVAIADGWNVQATDNLTIYVVQAAQITSLSTNSAPAGSGPIQLAISGSGFQYPTTIGNTPVPGSAVTWTPPGLALNNPTITGSGTQQLNVTIPGNLLAATGIFSVNVVNAANTVSNGLAFTVYPTITAINTLTRTAGTPAFTLGVTGTGFVNGSVVKMNGTSIPTVFVNGASLTATVPSIATPGSVLIAVQNPDTTVTPTPQTLTILQAPAISSLSPASVNTGSPAFTLTVLGTRFQPGMTIYFNSAPLPTTLANNERNNMLMATVPASVLNAAATVPVAVGTSDGYLTPSLPFTIISPGPPPLQLLTFSPLPSGTVGVAYSTTFTASQGAGGYAFSVTAGTLPPGLQLSPTGVLSGTPTTFGASQFTVQVSDSAQNTVSRDFALNIAPAPLQLTTPALSNTSVNTPSMCSSRGPAASRPIPSWSSAPFRRVSRCRTPAC